MSLASFHEREKPLKTKENQRCSGGIERGDQWHEMGYVENFLFINFLGKSRLKVSLKMVVQKSPWKLNVLNILILGIFGKI